VVRVVLRLTDCLKKGNSPHIVLTSAEFIEEGARFSSAVNMLIIENYVW
jgi:hypothetical protein